MLTRRINMLLSKRKIFLFLLSFLVLIPVVLYLLKITYIVPRASAITSVEKRIEKKYYAPIQIVIAKVGIDLSVEEASITNGVWQIAETGASHLTSSAKPGEQGPIIIYAHNTNDRFGPIRWLEVGDLIQIQTADKKQHDYKISKTLIREHDDVTIFAKIKKETVVLYTCDGFGDTDRFMILAESAN